MSILFTLINIRNLLYNHHPSNWPTQELQVVSHQDKNTLRHRSNCFYLCNRRQDLLAPLI